MTGIEAREAHDSRAGQSVDVSSLIESLRRAGAARFDPVRMHYLQVLARRALGHPTPVKRLLDARLMQALAGFRGRFEQAQGDAKQAIAQTVPHFPEATDDLQSLLKAGDFNAVRRLIASLKSAAVRVSLADLTRSMAEYSAGKVGAGRNSTLGPGSELQTTQYFRETWSKLSVGKRVTQELDQAPKNAGPINSHMLVLRSLVTMRDISPDYLSRFTSYVDTLLILDQSGKETQVATRKAKEGMSGKKSKSRSSSA